ncbi:hypothetical protein SH2C18_31810 [Clostridium sediminicola]|uniref:hypothetical protein n=1 Tax=Clostridium sediminicola TaxID=3114879 RepID=UPI0031F23FEC
MDNNNAVELFFASLDESTMEELINIYLSSDEKKLNDYLDKLPSDVPKEELRKNLPMLKHMKEMMGDFF